MTDIIKTVPGPDGKPIENCLDGDKCSHICKYQMWADVGCWLWGGDYGNTPHPNCLGPEIETGPVDHSSVRVDESFWLLQSSSLEKRFEFHIELVIDPIEIKGFLGIFPNIYPQFVLKKDKKNRKEFTLFEDDKIYKTKTEAKEAAIELLLKKIEELKNEKSRN